MTSAHDNFALWCSQELARVEDALTLWIAADAPANLGEPMRYAVLDGGKRLRPLLVLAAAQAVGSLDASQAEAALRAGCAVELIHAYSLVHDDMPCMDNDVLRRGKPTVHVQFGQAQALLAGDALQALAFEILVPEGSAISDGVQARLCRQLAWAAGYNGMAGGQAIDLASVGKQLSREQLQQMHKLKTGALLQASVEMGATCAGIQGAALAALKQYGAALGLAFQVIDDVLDVVADSATLGKTAGKDADNDKPTYVSLMGLQPARDYAHELLAEAQRALAGSGLPQTAALAALADMVVRRSH
ncbi:MULTISPECIES: polyprenyl synthetase family protein [Comamonas]|uniref:Polyprenyl synthetase family protein n=1 Tax=Comamonas squillarum TaxID=2977320 RepID=A0ABY6A1S5_9BURK|nr:MULTISPECIES: farnesyl diphosphate synthase [Comamonas]PWB18568.1 polyprenyl synthetase [Comamonas sp. JNW]UXC20128.1 polyprenyl synthetase family protein [Comamonas sp. PR12]